MYISFLHGLITCSIYFVFIYAFIALILKVFGKYFSPITQHYVWMLSLLPLVLPFLPFKSLLSSHFFSNSMYNDFANQYFNVSNGISTTTPSMGPSHLLQDFSVSINRTPRAILIAIFFLWLFGVLVLLIPTIRSMVRLRKLRRTLVPLTQTNHVRLFETCKQECGIHHTFFLGTSKEIRSPITFGYFKSYIVLPEDTLDSFSEQELRYIYIHELQHYKNKDFIINICFIIIQILYWFHPLIWLALKEVNSTREINCDDKVLSKLDDVQIIEYGHTLLNFISSSSNLHKTAGILEISSSKKQMKRRIQYISGYSKKTPLHILKHVLSIIMISCLLFYSFPILTLASSDSYYYGFDGKNVEYVDLNEYFEGFEGSFVLYDMKEDHYTIYNEQASKTRVSPNSTYKLYSGLIALESKVISVDNSHIPWDGTYYPYDSWNFDQTLDTAIRSSVNWYFKELDQQIQFKTIQHYLKLMNYGNCNLFAPIDEYWLESSLAISPIEQVQLLTNFYTNSFSFQEENIEFLKNAIKINGYRDRSIYGKTGTGQVNDHIVNGWFIGFVETSDNVYIYATNIKGKDNASGSKAVDITYSILNSYGIYEHDFRL